MISRILKLFTILVLLSTALAAQTNIGSSYYYLNDYQKAKQYFENELSKNPNYANAYYYLGEIAFSEGNAEKAKDYYNKGLSIDPQNKYNQIGLAKLGLKINTKEAESTFASILKKDKKDVSTILAVGRAYLDNGMLKGAEKQVAEARKVNEKNPEIYILEGDIILNGEENVKKYGNAAGKYEMANYFDPDYALAYVKTAKIYENINSKLAIEKLQTIIEKQPNYSIAYSYLGKIYTQNGFYPQAIEAYNTYISYGTYTVDDIERYARALYFSNSYTDAENMVEKGLQENPDHFVLNRYKMYIAAKQNNTDKGLSIAQKFFSLREQPSGYIAQDYAIYAAILNNAQQYSKAILQYNQAIELEPDRLETYTEAAAMTREKKDYVQTATYLQQQMHKKAELAEDASYADNVVDINALGYDYYMAGVAISKNQQPVEDFGLMKKGSIIKELLTANKSLNEDSLTSNIDYFAKAYSTYYLNKAEVLFDTLIQRLSNAYSGYRLKALTKHALNSNAEDGVAQPYYEKVVEIITGKDDITAAEARVLIEAYSYLGYFYYMNSDEPNTILYWNKVLELDPDNKNAKLILEDLNK